MYRYLLRRLVGGVVSIWGISTLVFFIMRVTTDPVAVILPPDATAADAEQLRMELGLDQPILVQYWDFISGLVTGDLGDSFHFREPAMGLILERIPATLELVMFSMVVALIISIPAGILAASKQNSIFDYLASFFSFLGFATPGFWLGIIMVIIFGVKLQWFPTYGRGGWEHLILPGLTLAAWPLGQFSRMVRSEMLDVLNEDYVRTAHAKGLSSFVVLLKHGFRNASISLISLIGVTFGLSLGGAIVVETIFAWPGMGRLVIEAVTNRDLPIIQGTVVYFSVIFVLINLLVDLIYSIVDPRIRVD